MEIKCKGSRGNRSDMACFVKDAIKERTEEEKKKEKKKVKSKWQSQMITQNQLF